VRLCSRNPPKWTVRCPALNLAVIMTEVAFWMARMKIQARMILITRMAQLTTNPLLVVLQMVRKGIQSRMILIPTPAQLTKNPFPERQSHRALIDEVQRSRNAAYRTQLQVVPWCFELHVAVSAWISDCWQRGKLFWYVASHPWRLTQSGHSFWVW